MGLLDLMGGSLELSRHDIVAHKLVGEANSVNTEVVDGFRAGVANDLVSRYHVENFYNCDEAGLSYNWSDASASDP